MKELIIKQNDAGQRLDRFVGKAVPLLPEALLQKYIRLKRIKLNGKGAKRDTRLSVGDTLQLQDGTTVELTPELHGLMGQFHQSVESQLGQGTVDAMLQYAGTLDAGTQSTLERMVMSGDPAQMSRAVQYLQERMAGGSITGYVPNGQTAAQPVGMSHAEFIAAYDQLSQWAQQSGYGPGHRQYDDQYRALVAQRSAGKRAGR